MEARDLNSPVCGAQKSSGNSYNPEMFEMQTRVHEMEMKLSERDQQLTEVQAQLQRARSEQQQIVTELSQKMIEMHVQMQRLVAAAPQEHGNAAVNQHQEINDLHASAGAVPLLRSHDTAVCFAPYCSINKQQEAVNLQSHFKNVMEKSGYQSKISEELNLLKTSAKQRLLAEDTTEQMQETNLICKLCRRSLKEPRQMSCCREHICHSCAPDGQHCLLCGCEQSSETAASVEEDADSWVVVERAEVTEPGRLRRGRLLTRPSLFSKKKVDGHPIRICKELIKNPHRPCNSEAFYTSEGDNGYLMQIKFNYRSTTDHQNNVCVYVCMRKGKNDENLRWPLKATVIIIQNDCKGSSTCPHQRWSITGRWEKPGPGTQWCNGELNIPYEKLQAGRDGMLDFIVHV